MTVLFSLFTKKLNIVNHDQCGFTNSPRPRLSGSQSLGWRDSLEGLLALPLLSSCPESSCGLPDQEAFVASGPLSLTRPASAGGSPGPSRLETVVRSEAMTLTSVWTRLARVCLHRRPLGCLCHSQSSLKTFGVFLYFPLQPIVSEDTASSSRRKIKVPVSFCCYGEQKLGS